MSAVYANIIDEAFKLIVDVYNADETTPGWSNQGNNKENVKVFKLNGEGADCYKGTCEIKVPLPYAMQYVGDLQYKKEYDTRFQKGVTIEELDKATSIFHLEYTPVWPTSGRDFCSISIKRHLKEKMYAIAVKGVEHPNCPPTKNMVRGEVMIGGFVVKEISADPPLVELTYVTRVNLGGSIPTKLGNKFASEQPMFAASIRKHVESRYQKKDPATSGDELMEKINQLPSIL